MPPELAALEPAPFTEVVVAVCGVGKAEYVLGYSSIFFR